MSGKSSWHISLSWWVVNNPLLNIIALFIPNKLLKSYPFSHQKKMLQKLLQEISDPLANTRQHWNGRCEEIDES